MIMIKYWIQVINITYGKGKKGNDKCTDYDKIWKNTKFLVAYVHPKTKQKYTNEQHTQNNLKIL